MEVHVDRLPAAQRRLWRELGDTPKSFVLCGGTAIALQLGHRRSVDFYFFCFANIDTGQLRADVGYLQGAVPVQSDVNTLTMRVLRGRPVLVSFFGVPRLSLVKKPITLTEPAVRLASLVDLAAMKLAVITRRAQLKDYLDLCAIFRQTEIGIPQALAAAGFIFGAAFNPLIALKALGHLDDLSLQSLRRGDAKLLRELAGAIKPRDLPALMRSQTRKELRKL